MFESKNVFGEELIPCSQDPLTGFFRDGCCNTDHNDHGMHTVCVQVTDEFLEFSKSKGNDLTTAMPQFNFPGLKEGDYWCLCAPRWMEAHQAGAAPNIRMESTHEETLAIIPIDLMRKYALKSAK